MEILFDRGEKDGDNHDARIEELLQSSAFKDYLSDIFSRLDIEIKNSGINEPKVSMRVFLPTKETIDFYFRPYLKCLIIGAVQDKYVGENRLYKNVRGFASNEDGSFDLELSVLRSPERGHAAGDTVHFRV